MKVDLFLIYSCFAVVAVSVLFKVARDIWRRHHGNRGRQWHPEKVRMRGGRPSRP